MLRIEHPRGGRSCLDEAGYVQGAPELVAEVAASSASIDLRQKKRVYERNGVQEYLVWQVFEQRLDWFCLREGEYGALSPDAEGIVRSQVFPGLWLAANELLGGNLQVVLQVLQRGMSTSECQQFVQRLAQA